MFLHCGLLNSFCVCSQTCKSLGPVQKKLVSAWEQNFLHKREILSLLSTMGSISNYYLWKAGKLSKRCVAHLQNLINISPTGVQCSSNPNAPQPGTSSNPFFVRSRGVRLEDICSIYKNCMSKHKLHRELLKKKTVMRFSLSFQVTNKYNFDCLNSIHIFINWLKTQELLLNSLQTLCLTSLCCNAWPEALLFLTLMEQS